MATEVLLPQWGMEMAEGTIVKWFKNEGDTIQEGEPLVAIETAKLETDLESVASGVVSHIMVPEGATVPIRTILAVIGEPGEEVARPGGAAPAPAAAAPVGSSMRVPAAAQAGADGMRVQVVPAARRLAQENDIDLAQVQGSGPRGRVLIADVEQAIESSRQASLPAPAEGARVQVVPAARRLAQQNGVDLATVKGSGPNGRVLIADVERAIATPPAAGPEPVQLTGMRRTIAARMLQSAQTSAPVTLMSEANITEAMTLRAGLARQWSEHGLSPLALVIKAAARALKDHPRLNAVQGEDSYQVMPNIDIGVAVSLEEGLITPVLRGADGKGLAQIAEESRELASKVREGRARPEEVTGGTFTITNLGANDVDGFTPIINPPQVAILGVGRVLEKPVINNGEIAKGQTMFLSLTFDHRIVDGAPAAAFLQTVKRYLEDPWWMVA